MFTIAAKWVLFSLIMAGVAESARADVVVVKPVERQRDAAPRAATGAAADAFYRAFYLESQEDDCASAVELYEVVVADTRADGDLRAEARVRLQGCQEELIAADFARLVPSTTIAYAEVRRPGPQLAALLDQLGLLADETGVAEAGAPMKRLAISPALFREPLGLKGVAVAITGFDPMKGEPTGMGLVHFGDPAGLRAWAESVLPVVGTPIAAIGGFPAFQIEDEAVVALTGRLAIVARNRGSIEQVTRRLAGTEQDSLAANEEFARAFGDRGESVLFFAVNAKPIMPVLNGFLATAAIKSPEAAMAQTLLDPNSLESLSGQIGVTDAGLKLDLSLRLAEGHRNLVFHFLKTPAVDRRTLRCVPAGAVGFAAAALNEPVSRHDAAPPTAGEAVQVSFLDLGREIFANITTIAAFVLPGDEAAASGAPIPNAAVVMTVNDPARSLALWGQALGLASVAFGGGVLEGSEIQIDGVRVRAFAMPEGITVHLMADGRDVIMASTPRAVRMALQAKNGSDSVLDDEAFATGLTSLNANTSVAMLVHPGRAMSVARQFMSEREIQEMEPFRAALERTVAAVVVSHGSSTLDFRATLTGLPDLSGVVTVLIEEEQRREQRAAELEQLIDARKWDQAVALIDARMAAGESGLMTRKFNVLAVGKKDHAAASQWGQTLCEKIKNDANALNTFAWNLLTEEKYGGAYAKLALACAERSNELTQHQRWMYVDTLALAKFETGAVEEAIALQKRAIELSDGAGMAEMEKALKRFEEAATRKVAAGG